MGWQHSLLALLAMIKEAESGRDSIRTSLSADGAVLAFAGPAVLPGSALVRHARGRAGAPFCHAATAGGDSADTGTAAAEHPPTRYPIPVLVPFAVADAEVNVAVPPPARRRSLLPWAPGHGWAAQPSARRRRGNQKDKPGFKPVAGLGALLGFLAAGPAGALAGAAASVVASGKDSLAGDTVRTAAKAAETLGGAAWDVTSRAADAANVEGFVRRGIDEVGSWTSDGRPPKT